MKLTTNISAFLMKCKDFIKQLTFILSKRQKVLGIIGILLSLISAVLQTIGVSIIVPLVTMFTDSQKLMSHPLVARICEFLSISSISVLFVYMCVGVILLYIFKDVFSVFQLWYSAKYACLVQRELATKMLKGYLRKNYDFFLNYGTAQAMRDITSDTNATYGVISHLGYFITEFITMSALMIYIFVSDFVMAICIFALAFVCLLLIYTVFKKDMRKNGEELRVARAENDKVLLQAIQGIKEVQIMKKQGFFVEEFNATYLAQQKPALTQTIGASVPTYIIEAIFVSGVMSLIAIRVYFDPSYIEHFAVMASFLVAAIRILPSLGRISSALNNISFGIPGYNKLYRNLKMLDEEERQAKEKHEIEDSGDCIEYKNELQLRNISWRYKDASDYVLKNMNLIVNKGESIGIIGASGAGKSTLADIILGLHIPQEGNITIDGVDIQSIPFEYSRVIGYVPQNIFLVDATVRENVAFGVKPDEIDDEKVWNALRQAQLYDFVKDLEQGINTKIGDYGVRFSGGQRQRIAIARALYREPQILILDEATSALDNETEAAFMEAIEGLYGEITMLIIAHRITTVRKCDKVYEVRDKNIKEKDKKELFSFA